MVEQQIQVKLRLERIYEEQGSWRKVARFLLEKSDGPYDSKKINSVAVLARASYKGRSSATIEKLLGFPPREVKVKPCPCGDVHAKKCYQGQLKERMARSSNPELLARITNKEFMERLNMAVNLYMKEADNDAGI